MSNVGGRFYIDSGGAGHIRLRFGLLTIVSIIEQVYRGRLCRGGLYRGGRLVFAGFINLGCFFGCGWRGRGFPMGVDALFRDS
ncbi:MAG TPA: hypothetical protein QF455_01850, partial [Phycisphaerales bacterium]|nr:hypothetical protein [Phycisphaerales bacterium]